MNARTLLGQLITSDGLARRAHWHQPEPELVGPLQYRARLPVLRTDHLRIDRHQVNATQPDWIGIKLGHTDCVGRAEHLEQHASGLWIIGEIYSDVPPELRYLSPEYRARGDGSNVTITGAGLTDEPAQICMRPVTILDGALGDCSTRGLQAWQADMLKRARTATRHRTRGQGIEVHDPGMNTWAGDRGTAGTLPPSRRLRHASNPSGMFISTAGRVLGVR